MAMLHTGEIETAVALGAGAKTCDSADSLSTFNSQDTELVIWQRALSMPFQTWMEEVNPLYLPEQRVLVRPSDVPRMMEKALKECGMPIGEMRDLLVSDIQDLVTIFAGIIRKRFCRRAAGAH